MILLNSRSIYYDDVNSQVLQYDGSAWVALGGGNTVIRVNQSSHGFTVGKLVSKNPV